MITINEPKPEKGLPSPTKTRTGLFPAEKKPQLRAPDQKLISKATADRIARKAHPEEEEESPDVHSSVDTATETVTPASELSVPALTKPLPSRPSTVPTPRIAARPKAKPAPQIHVPVTRMSEGSPSDEEVHIKEAPPAVTEPEPKTARTSRHVTKLSLIHI